MGDELSLGQRRHSSIPTTICRFPTKASKIMNVAVEQGCKLEEHVQKLEEEKRKIQGSELELPLCLQMLNDAISYLKTETETDTQPLLKDFISLSKPIREEHDEELFKEKKFQLWRENDHISNARFSDTLEIERGDEKSSDSLYMLLSPRMTTQKMVKGRRKLVASSSVPHYLQQQALRKQRRCWTPELHRLFVDALQQLGGPGVATPKQIREHMQEEGLTNDEVKSHLQKYRLHIRKTDSNLEKQSVVVLGFNLWNSSQEVEESGEGGETSKRSNSQSDSPQGPLQLPCTTTTTCGDSSMEDAEDAKSERRY
ncbi:LOW QUALITY PROTEIN: hypothetical protein HID58_018512 [Brassica napus]|uniref:HTH myb-type domain-containing protein n=1 Tax=Brassica napus TaxID=3708 RepID=A0ABQ8DCV1_BRANA|nr:LOW QUALITY PROTEIN: hypothetical protein HID58_018512 [Brassica napus]